MHSAKVYTRILHLSIYMCPHTTIYVSAYYTLAKVYTTCILLRCIPAYYTLAYICARILLYMCPHTTIYVSAYYYICVRILHRILHLSPSRASVLQTLAVRDEAPRMGP
jgi:hypothetical protein